MMPCVGLSGALGKEALVPYVGLPQPLGALGKEVLVPCVGLSGALDKEVQISYSDYGAVCKLYHLFQYALTFYPYKTILKVPSQF